MKDYTLDLRAAVAKLNYQKPSDEDIEAFLERAMDFIIRYLPTWKSQDKMLCIGSVTFGLDRYDRDFENWYGPALCRLLDDYDLKNYIRTLDMQCVIVISLDSLHQYNLKYNSKVMNCK